MNLVFAILFASLPVSASELPDPPPDLESVEVEHPGLGAYEEEEKISNEEISDAAENAPAVECEEAQERRSHEHRGGNPGNRFNR